MRSMLLLAPLLSACSAQPVCYVTRTLGLKVVGVVQPIDVPSQTVTVCITPPSIELSTPAP